METSSKKELYSYYLSDNIFHCSFNFDVEIDIDLAMEMFKTRLTFTQNKPHTVLFDVSKIISISKEARDFFSTQESSRGIQMAAILSKSPLSTMIVEFFIAQLPVGQLPPIKMFHNKEEAMNWLLSGKT